MRSQFHNKNSEALFTKEVNIVLGEFLKGRCTDATKTTSSIQFQPIFNYFWRIKMVFDCSEKGKLRATITEISVLAIALGVVLALFSLPVIFYYMSVSVIFIYLVNTLNRNVIIREKISYI